MEKVWLLLKGVNHTAQALPIQTHWGEANEASYLKVIVTPNSHDALDSAKESSQQTYHILRKEGYLRKSTLIRYKIENAPVNIIGKSAGLAFALAFVTKALLRRNFKAIAATGIVTEKGIITRVEGFPEKVNAALVTLPRNSQLYYPEQNNPELTPDLRQRAQEREVELIAVNRLEEAFEHLGVKLKKIYSYSPYQGLNVFQFEHAGIFFGRSREIETLCQQLNTRAAQGAPSVLVVGSSGSGKSSLVLAGVLPELIRRDGWPTTVQGRYSVFRPRHAQQQTRNHAEALTPQQELDSLFQTVAASWQQGLQTEQNPPQPDVKAEWDASALIAWLHETNNALPKPNSIESNRFIWVVDQLEELFTAGFQSETIKRFCGFLAAVAKQDIWLILTLRNDYYDQYQRQTALMEHFRDNGQYNLSIIGREAIAQIIQEPAQMADCTFEADRDQGNLADRIKRDVGDQSGILPLLEFTLSELYEYREKTQRLFTHQAYEAFGGLEGSIGHRAETVYQDFEVPVQEALPSLIRALSVVGSHHERPVAARAIALSQYPADSPKRTVIDQMTDERLFIKEGTDEKEVQVRVSHEALLTIWQRASKQIERERRDLELMRQLEEQAQRRLTAAPENQPSLLLHTGLPLTEAEDLLERFTEDLPVGVRDYIQASQQAEQARIAIEVRQRKLSSRLRNLAVTLIVAVALIAVWQWKVAESRRFKAEQQTNLAFARQFAAESQNAIQNQPKEGLLTGALLAIQSLKKVSTAQGTLAWQRYVNLLLPLRSNPITYGSNYNESSFRSIAISPEGNRVVSVGKKGIVRINDSETGKDITEFNLKPIVTGDLFFESSKVRYDPNGQLIVSVSSWSDKKNYLAQVTFWSIALEKIISQYSFKGNIKDFDLSPDGTTFTIGANNGEVISRNIVNGNELFRNNDFDKGALAVAYSPDGFSLAIASRDDTVRILDSTSGKEIHQFKAVSTPSSVAWSHDGKFLAAGTYSGDIYVWKTSPAEIQAHMKHDRDVWAGVNFIQNSFLNHLVSGSLDGTAVIWNIYMGDRQFELRHDGEVIAFKLSKDGTLLATASTDGMIRLWDVKTGKEIKRIIQEGVHAIDLFRNGDKIMIATAGKGEVKIWNITPKISLFSYSLENHLNDVAFTKDGSQVITALKNEIIVWDAITGKKKNQFINSAEVETITISHDGQLIASWDDQKTVTIWESVTGKIISSFKPKGWKTGKLKFTKNNHFILNEIYSPKGKPFAFQLWETLTGKQIARFPKTGWVNEYSSSNSDKDRLIMSDDEYVQIWDINNVSEKPLSQTGFGGAIRLEGNYFILYNRKDKGDLTELWNSLTGKKVIAFKFREGIKNFTISENEKLIAFDHKRSITIFDIKSGKQLFKFKPSLYKIFGTPDYFVRAEFSLDNKKIAAITTHGNILLWDTSNGKKINEFHLPQKKYSNKYGLAFSPDSQYLAASGGKEIRIWDLATNLESFNWKLNSSNGSFGTTVQFGPKGRWFLSSSNTYKKGRILPKQLLFWRQEDMISQLCHRISLNFTDKGSDPHFQDDVKVFQDELYRKSCGINTNLFHDQVRN